MFEDPNVDSVLFLQTTMARLYVKGFKLVNVDIIIHAQEPTLGRPCRPRPLCRK